MYHRRSEKENQRSEANDALCDLYVSEEIKRNKNTQPFFGGYTFSLAISFIFATCHVFCYFLLKDIHNVDLPSGYKGIINLHFWISKKGAQSLFSLPKVTKQEILKKWDTPGDMMDCPQADSKILKN